jgi:hypothetical protein
MLNPTPELPDDIPIREVELSTRIRNILEAAGLKTVGTLTKRPTKYCLASRISDRTLSGASP